MFSTPPRLMPGARVFVDEVHVHLDVELGALADAQEVDVQRLVLDGIELVVARNARGASRRRHRQ